MKTLSKLIMLVLATVILTVSTACSTDNYAGAYISNGADKTIFDVAAEGAYTKVTTPSDKQTEVAQNLLLRVFNTTSVDTTGSNKEYTLQVNVSTGAYPENNLLTYTLVSAKNRNTAEDGTKYYTEVYYINEVQQKNTNGYYYYNAEIYNVVENDVKRGYESGFALVGDEIGADGVSKNISAIYAGLQYDWLTQLNNSVVKVFDAQSLSAMVEYNVVKNILNTITFSVYTSATGKTATVYTVDPLELVNYGLTTYVVTVVSDGENIKGVSFYVEGDNNLTLTAEFQYCNNVVAPVNALLSKN